MAILPDLQNSEKGQRLRSLHVQSKIEVVRNHLTPNNHLNQIINPWFEYPIDQAPNTYPDDLSEKVSGNIINLLRPFSKNL